MKKFLSTAYSDAAFNVGTFLIRIVVGFLMCINHGIPKIAHFAEWQNSFYNPFHIGSRSSLVMSILAEVFASMFFILGLFTRIAALLLVIDLGVAIFLYQRPNPISRYEDAILFFTGSMFILLAGPGKYSVDGLTGK
jgi:putative oxidoreductase